ncbi:myo-inosose-2 dehydratase [Luteimonas sp. SJ-92]|uniref:Myo-inosose-2 dehydratase n=1 Tax=Luteimonas salinisoli TaxID=2752307 RepID=A0A853JEF5_9GAMM|nr:myo-inosose-2 dehydratase [Luteimonas salinisoli]NZA26888.1 myo-inosose-2 dehydratase [Luteimonas salinisoli]
MSIRFGVSPIAWSNDDMPELGGDTPLARILADIRDIGFAGVELGGRFPRAAAELRPLLTGYGLDLIGGWYSGALLARDATAEIAALQPHLRLLEAMGSTAFVFAETSNAVHGDRAVPLTGAPRLEEGAWAEFGARMTEVADHVQGHGLRFAYHHHLGTVVERAEDLERLLRHTGDSVGLTLDTGHAALGGIDPLQVIAAHPRRIAHVHCKDVRRAAFERLREDGASFLDGVLGGMFTVPGDGDLDYAPVMRALAGIGYSGWIVIEAEQDPAVAAPRPYAELGLRTLRHEAVQAGLI